MKFVPSDYLNAELTLVSNYRPSAHYPKHKMANFNLKSANDSRYCVEIFYGIASFRYPIPSFVSGVRVRQSDRFPFGIISNS